MKKAEEYWQALRDLEADIKTDIHEAMEDIDSIQVEKDEDEEEYDHDFMVTPLKEHPYQAEVEHLINISWFANSELVIKTTGGSYNIEEFTLTDLITILEFIQVCKENYKKYE